MQVIQIQPLQDRVKAWDNGGKQAWINKNYPGFVDHFNSELVEKTKQYTETKRMSTHWQRFNWKLYDKVMEAKKNINPKNK